MATDHESQSGASFGPERFVEVVEALPVGVFILAADGSAVYANGAAKELLGRGIFAGDHAENLGERYAAYVSGTNDVYPTARMPVVRALAGERTTVDDMEVDRRGVRVALEVTATPILDGERRVQFAVAVFKDVTPRREAQRALAKLNADLEAEVNRRTADLAEIVNALEREIETRRLHEAELLYLKAEAERANRAKSVFLMNVSHELRTPLNHIIGFNDLLTDRIDDARSRRLSETAGAGGRELLEKVDALIDLARADAEPHAGTLNEVDLHALLLSAATPYGIRCDVSEELGTVRSYEQEMRQVLSGVFSRAAASQPSELVVSARTDRNDGAGCFTVRIPCDELAGRVRALAGVFGESPQDEETQYRQQPIDLRLAVARAHARSLGGDIAAESEDGRIGVNVILPFAEV